MPPRRDRVERVPPVELTDGEEVHRGEEHPDPCRAVNRADLEQRLAVKEALEQE